VYVHVCEKEKESWGGGGGEVPHREDSQMYLPVLCLDIGRVVDTHAHTHTHTHTENERG
jgi:hypothetical protein